MAFNFFAKKKRPVSGRPTKDDYENLGKQVAALYDHINPDRAGLYRTAFLKGVVTGLGGVIGATVVLALLVWTLSLFDQLPGVGRLVKALNTTIQQSQAEDKQ